MSDYIVSARKYRPATFDTVVGQSALTTTLKNAIASGKLAHAYLFCGPRGVGKTTSARIFAKTINCLNPLPTGEACDACESCQAFNEQRSYNIHELDAASNNSVDDIRDLIEQVQVPPQVGRYKVFIIDEVHMLSTAAFNAFLKTLEEPPAHAIFILATTEKHKILPTILSRCQIYDFNRMEVPDIVSHLKHLAENEGYTAEEEALNVIARKADGGMRDALSIFDQVAMFSQGNITYQKAIENLNVLDYDYYFDITDSLLKGDVTKTILTLNEILSHGFGGNHFIGGLASHFRDLLVSRDPQTLPLLEVAESVRQRYQEQAARCTPKFLYAALRLCNDCDCGYRTARNKRLLVEITLIEVAQLNSEDADAAGGRRPTKRLLPIFAPDPAQVAVTQSTHIPQRPAVPASNIPQQTAPVQRNTTTPQQPVRRQIGSNPVITSKLSTISLRNRPTLTSSVASATPVQSPVQQVAQPQQPLQQQPFTDDDLRLQWLSFANLLPQRERAEAARLKMVQPVIKDKWRIEAAVENQIAANQINLINQRLTQHLRETLHNDYITVVFPVNPSATVHHAYSPRDILTDMLGKNNTLARLIKEFDLQLE